MAIKKYRPSNGSEGCMFEAAYCDECWRDVMDEQGNYIRQCDIHDRALLYDIDEPEYPDEWRICPATGESVCTAFTKEKPAKPFKPSPGQLFF